MVECTPSIINILQIAFGYLLGRFVVNIVIPFISGFIRGYKKSQGR